MWTLLMDRVECWYRSPGVQCAFTRISDAYNFRPKVNIEYVLKRKPPTKSSVFSNVIIRSIMAYFFRDGGHEAVAAFLETLR